ncbi:DUF4123 domain-containing protein [uncultured Amphritea sp.]|uniref:DUF4123 domain-containing protein n=1 Tax=uncultured Amphritea sp. TaxID=981605 RepID=UPI00262D8C6C|nr:DUF4123 domain-containing protein [uncultured Amphritea sp.]
MINTLEKTLNDMPGMTAYLLADFHPEQLQTLFEVADLDEKAALFSGTLFNEQLSYSPWLFEFGTTSQLFEYYAVGEEGKSAPQGIILIASTELSFAQVLAQLQNRLVIRFDGQRQGLLHFQSPVIAHYLFNDSAAADTDRWLGKLSGVIWRHAELKGQTDTWYVHMQQHLGGADQKEWELTESQQQALVRLKTDQLIKQHHKALFTDTESPVTDEWWQLQRHYIDDIQNCGVSDTSLILQYLQQCHRPDSEAVYIPIPQSAERIRALPTEQQRFVVATGHLI